MYAAVCGGSGEPGDIQQRAAADGNEARMAVQVGAEDVRMEFVDERARIFGGLAAADQQRRKHEFQAGSMHGKVVFNPVLQFRQRLREGIIQG